MTSERRWIGRGVACQYAGHDHVRRKQDGTAGNVEERGEDCLEHSIALRIRVEPGRMATARVNGRIAGCTLAIQLSCAEKNEKGSEEPFKLNSVATQGFIYMKRPMQDWSPSSMKNSIRCPDANAAVTAA